MSCFFVYGIVRNLKSFKKVCYLLYCRLKNHFSNWLQNRFLYIIYFFISFSKWLTNKTITRKNQSMNRLIIVWFCFVRLYLKDYLWLLFCILLQTKFYDKNWTFSLIITLCFPYEYKIVTISCPMHTTYCVHSL